MTFTSITQVDLFDQNGVGGSNGLYDTLRITLDISVPETGTYRLAFGLFDEDNNWYQGFRHNFWLNEGPNTISISVLITQNQLTSGTHNYKFSNIRIGKFTYHNSLYILNNRIIGMEHDIGILTQSDWENDWCCSSIPLFEPVLINGTPYSWVENEPIQFSAGDILNITVIAIDGSYYPMYINVYIDANEISDFRIPLIPTGDGKTFIGFMKLEKDIEGTLTMGILDQYGFYEDVQIREIQVLGYPIPTIIDVSFSYSDTILYEARPFSIMVLMLHKNLTFTNLNIGIGRLTSIDWFDLSRSWRNVTHEMYEAINVSTNIIGELSAVVTFDINGVTISKLVEYAVLTVIDDANPTIIDVTIPTVLYTGISFNVSVNTSDDFGIDYVEIKIISNSVSQTVRMIPVSVDSNKNGYYKVSLNIDSEGAVNFIVYVYDTIGQRSSESDLLNLLIYDPQGPDVIDYGHSEEDTDLIAPGTEITFFISFNKQDEVITSVSMKINAGQSIAFEKEEETETSETWTANYTPTDDGQYTIEITALNTANKHVTITMYIDVESEESSQQTFSSQPTPGFELLPLLFFLIILNLVKSYRKRK
ncbi:MAG: hypothetical protein ACXAD7_28895 [Candidatus Kariarchaeaceae archaeon]|jgi:hypothetical protein